MMIEGFVIGSLAEQVERQVPSMLAKRPSLSQS